MKRQTQSNHTYVEKDSAFFEGQLDNFNLLLVTVTPVEKITLHNAMKPIAGETGLVKVHKDSQSYYLGMFGKYHAVHVNCDNMGSGGLQASQATTSDAIIYCKPQAVVMMGIAMGASNKHKIGDVLISESIIPYESQRVGAEETISRAQPGQASLFLLNRFKQVVNWNHKINKRTPSIIPGEILSGEKLVDNLDFKKELLNGYPNAKGLEMEGFGVYVASSRKSVHWIVVKAICDYGDGEKKIKKENRQRVAASSATNLCLHVFESPHAFKDMGLIAIVEEVVEPASSPKIVDIPPNTTQVEQEIIQEMVSDENSIPVDLTANLREMVRTYLNLGDIEKIKIAKNIGVYNEEFSSLNPHIRDRQIFIIAKQKNLLAEIWEALNTISPLTSQINPFKTVTK